MILSATPGGICSSVDCNVLTALYAGMTITVLPAVVIDGVTRLPGSSMSELAVCGCPECCVTAPPLSLGTAPFTMCAAWTIALGREGEARGPGLAADDARIHHRALRDTRCRTARPLVRGSTPVVLLRRMGVPRHAGAGGPVASTLLPTQRALVDDPDPGVPRAVLGRRLAHVCAVPGGADAAPPGCRVPSLACDAAQRGRRMGGDRVRRRVPAPRGRLREPHLGLPDRLRHVDGVRIGAAHPRRPRPAFRRAR